MPNKGLKKFSNIMTSTFDAIGDADLADMRAKNRLQRLKVEPTDPLKDKGIDIAVSTKDMYHGFANPDHEQQYALLGFNSLQKVAFILWPIFASIIIIFPIGWSFFYTPTTTFNYKEFVLTYLPSVLCIVGMMTVALIPSLKYVYDKYIGFFLYGYSIHLIYSMTITPLELQAYGWTDYHLVSLICVIMFRIRVKVCLATIAAAIVTALIAAVIFPPTLLFTLKVSYNFGLFSFVLLWVCYFIEKQNRQKFVIERFVCQLKDKSDQLQAENAEINSHDTLTGLLNARAFDDLLGYELLNCRNNGNKIALMMFEIDYFDSFAEKMGSAMAEATVLKVAQALETTVLQFPQYRITLARHQDARFALIVQHARQDDLNAIASYCIAIVDELKIVHRFSMISSHVTLSGGGALSYQLTHPNVTEFMSVINQALYLAQQEGRHRFKFAPQT